MSTSSIAPTTDIDVRAASPRPHRLSHRLDADWQHLRIAPRMLLHARRWADGDPDHALADVVADVHDLQQVVDATQGWAPGGNEILLRLVELARNGDELAGRVVVHRLLPALITRSRHYHLPDGRETIAEVITMTWVAIRSYDTERRRLHVAASLVSDAVFTACRQPLRRRSTNEETHAPDVFARMVHHDQCSGLEELAEVVRDAQRAGVPPAQLDLLRELARADSPAHVASARGVSARTIRKHREHAIAMVRHTVAA